ncbi:MAG TPA: DUF374 domain-containing protein [Chloroflexota bacterium]|nr:DUF374 domain-containing protein [Chloroflexota bacterium]
MTIRAALLGNLMFAGSRFVANTSDIHVQGLDAVLDQRLAGRPVIIVAWHAQATSYLAAYKLLFGESANGVLMPLSSHRGQVLGRFAERLGLTIVPQGDTPRSRARAVVQTMGLMRTGHVALLAADGPSGPCFDVKGALVRMAQGAGAVLVPSAVGMRRGVTLGWRWDRQRVPLPGAQIHFHFGRPVDPGVRTTDAVAEVLRLEIKRSLIEANAAVDSLVAAGRPRLVEAPSAAALAVAPNPLPLG